MREEIDDQPFGREIAQAAADWLKVHHYLVRVHRDYTGHGLYRYPDDGTFFLATSYDGYPRLRLRSFTTEDAFVDWLSRQSDLSMSGLRPTGQPDFDSDACNQRVTRKMLVALSAGRDSEAD